MPLPCAQWIHSHAVRGLCTYKVHYLQVMFVDMAQSTSDHIFVLVIFNQFLKHHFGSADLHISGVMMIMTGALGDMTLVRGAEQKPVHCPGSDVSIPALSPGDSHIPHPGSSGSFASSSWSSSPEISITSSHPSHGELAARPTELNLDPDILDTIWAFHFSAHKSVPFIPNPRRFCIMITKMKTLRTTLPRVILHSPSIRAILEHKWSHAS